MFFSRFFFICGFLVKMTEFLRKYISSLKSEKGLKGTTVNWASLFKEKVIQNYNDISFKLNTL